MFRVTIKNLLARKFRLVLTSIAVMLGVAFMAGTFVLTDTMAAVFDDLFTDVNKGVDVTVQGKAAFEDTGGPGTQVIREPFDETVLDTVGGVPGVEAAQGSVQGLAQVVTLVNGEPDDAIGNQAPTLGVSWGPNRKVSGAFQDVVGHRPNEANQVALDEVTAEDAGISNADVRACAEAGDCTNAQVQVNFFQHPPEVFDVVAVFKFGSVGNLAGATLAAFDTPTAQVLLNRVGKFDEIRVVKESDVTAAELRDRIRRDLRANDIQDVEVLTGKQQAQEQSDEIRDNLSFFNVFLLVFALIALFVGAFIIYNTFSIIVAQRTRELGLMRALGASGTQVTRSVGIEAAAVGLLSSILGLVVGVGVAIGLQQALRAAGIELPSGETVVALRTIVVSLVVGTAITFVSAVAPARRAATVSPMAALREHPAAPSSGRRRYRIGALLTVIGMIALPLGLFGGIEGVPGGSAALVGVAAALVFIGVAMLSPLAARPSAHFLGWFPARFRGMAGRLAQQNAERNPRRTASTAAALMVGLALVTVVATLGSSVKQTVKEVLADDYHAEITLLPEGFLPMPPEAAAAVRDAVPEAIVSEFRAGQVEIEGDTKTITGADPNFGPAVDIHPEAGALRRFRADGGLLLFRDVYDELTASERRSGLTIRFAKTGEQLVPIAGVYEEKDAVGTDYLLSMPLYELNFTDQQDNFVSIKLPPGVSVGDAERRVQAALEPFPSVDAQNRSEFQEKRESQIDQFLNFMYVMLLLAVGIALLGIVNALALSVFERTREIGLLRAVGMTRGQLRSMVRWEAVIISVFGALLGLALGVLFGVAIIQALADDGIVFAFPAGQLVLFLVLAAVAGLFAGWFPARRAGKLDVLRAVQSE
jgi:putative ABC transport system permease protein